MYSLTSRATWTRDGRKKLRSSRKWFDGWLLLDGGRLRLYDEDRRLVADEPCIERPHHVRSKWSDGDEMAPFRTPEYLVVPDPPVDREEFFVAPEGPKPLLPGVRPPPPPAAQRLPPPERAAARPARRPFRPPGPLSSLGGLPARASRIVDLTGSAGGPADDRSKSASRLSASFQRADLEEWDCEGEHAEAPIDPVDETARLVYSPAYRRPPVVESAPQSSARCAGAFPDRRGSPPPKSARADRGCQQAAGERMVDLLSTDDADAFGPAFKDDEGAEDGSGKADAAQRAEGEGEAVPDRGGLCRRSDPASASPDRDSGQPAPAAGKDPAAPRAVRAPSWGWATSDQTDVPMPFKAALASDAADLAITERRSPRTPRLQEAAPETPATESTKRPRRDGPTSESYGEECSPAGRPFDAFACVLRCEEECTGSDGQGAGGGERAGGPAASPGPQRAGNAGQADRGSDAAVDVGSEPRAGACGRRDELSPENGRAALQSSRSPGLGAVDGFSAFEPRSAGASVGFAERHSATDTTETLPGGARLDDRADGDDEDWNYEVPLSQRQEAQEPARLAPDGGIEARSEPATGGDIQTTSPPAARPADFSSTTHACDGRAPCAPNGAEDGALPSISAESQTDPAALAPRAPLRRKGVVLRTVDGAGLGPGSLAAARRAAKARGDPFEALRFPGPDGNRPARRCVPIADEFEGGVTEWLGNLEDAVVEEANLRIHRCALEFRAATANPAPGPPPAPDVVASRAKARGVPFFPAAELRVVERRAKRVWGDEGGDGRGRTAGRGGAGEGGAPGAPAWASNATAFLSLAAYVSRSGGRIRGCSKGDLWILGSDSSLRGEASEQKALPGRGPVAALRSSSNEWTCLALAEWHGPTPDGALKLSPLGRWPSRARASKSARVAALRGPDVGTELSILTALEAARKAWLAGGADPARRAGCPTSSTGDASYDVRHALPPLSDPGHRALLRALARPREMAPLPGGDPLAGAGLLLDPEAAAAAGAMRLNPEQFQALAHVASWASFGRGGDATQPAGAGASARAPRASPGAATASDPPPPDQLRVCLVHGPFGTGKSSVLVSMARYVALCRDLGPARAGGLQGARVLIASATNVAVDRVLLDLLGPVEEDGADRVDEREGGALEEEEEEEEEEEDDKQDKDEEEKEEEGRGGGAEEKGARESRRERDGRGGGVAAFREDADVDNREPREEATVAKETLVPQGSKPSDTPTCPAAPQTRTVAPGPNGDLGEPDRAVRRCSVRVPAAASRRRAAAPPSPAAAPAVPVLRVGALRRMHHRLLAHSLHVSETGGAGGEPRGGRRGGRGARGTSSGALADALADAAAEGGVRGSRGPARNAAVEDLRAMLRECAPGSAEALAAAAELARVRAGVERERRRRLATAPVVGATCHAILSGGLRGERFDVLVLDEASQMVEPLSAAVVAIAGCRFLVLAGDPAQLPPVVASPEFVSRAAETCEGAGGSHSPAPARAAPQPPLYGLARPMFVRLARAGVPTHLLRTQYRCHPAISAAPNAHFYAGRLRDGVAASDRAPLIQGLGPVLVVDIRLGRGATQPPPGPGGGRAGAPNPIEAGVVARLCRGFLAAGASPADVGIIATYRAQVVQVNAALERAEARDHARRELLGERAGVGGDPDALDGGVEGSGAAEIAEKGDGSAGDPTVATAFSAPCGRAPRRTPRLAIKVATVDSFQGAERDVIILTTSTNVSTSFLAAPERLNVALTRAKRHLVIVGCVPALEAASPALRDVVRAAKRTPGAYVPPGGRLPASLDAIG